MATETTNQTDEAEAPLVIEMTEEEMYQMVDATAREWAKMSAAEFVERYRAGTLEDGVGVSVVLPLARFAGLLDDPA